MRLEEIRTEVETLIDKLAPKVSTERVLRWHGAYSQIYDHLSHICAIIERELSHEISDTDQPS